MQPGESRRNCQSETAETDFFHTFGSEEDGDLSRKTEVQGNERDLAIEAKTHSNKQTHQNRARMRFNAFLCFQQGLTEARSRCP